MLLAHPHRSKRPQGVSARRGVVTGLIAAGGALAALALLVALRLLDLSGRPGLTEAIFAAGVLLAIYGLWHVYGVVDDHLKSLDRLRGALIALAGDPGAASPPWLEEAQGGEVARLHDALIRLLSGAAEVRATPGRRLQAVLASIAEALVVITEQGQVSLVNAAGKALLGAERVKVGTSVFAALERPSVVAAIEEAGAAGRPVEATLPTVDGIDLHAKVAGLGEHGGAVLSFPAEELEHRGELEHDLDLHDLPPVPGRLGDEVPLADLPALVLDTETTGLDVNADRVVSIGAVRMHGARVYRSRVFDRLVNPAVAIPPRAIAVHGITDAMVADAEAFAPVFDRLRPLLAGMVLIGHHVTFDILMLRRECQLAGAGWPDPPFLDTLLLAAALDVDWPGLGLEDLASTLGVDVHGRHTALGDSLVTAEVFARLIPLLQDEGVTTLGQAVAFSKRARAVIREQEKAGW